MPAFREPKFDADRVFEHNQAMQCAQHLVHEWGYEPLVDQQFAYQVDDQHALLITVDSKDFMTRGDFARAFGLAFFVARRDINEFLVQWDKDTPLGAQGWKYGTVWSVHTDFFPDRSFCWKGAVPFEDCVDQIDQAVAEFPKWADLERIEAAFYETNPPRLTYAWSALANSALNGDDRAEDLWERFMTYQVNDEEPLRSRAERYYQNTRAFRAQHPNGIPRA